jgi:NTE family protein
MAWKIGLVAGLLERGVDVTRADRIIGTSSGSYVGAALACGHSPESLVKDELELAEKAAANRKRGVRQPKPDLKLLLRFMSRRTADGSPAPPELRAWVCARAVETATDSEADFVSRFAFDAKLGRIWPKTFACTVTDVESGEFLVWDHRSGVELARAVAASMSVPGVSPAITVGGRRFFDGALRSEANIDVARGHQRILAIAVLSTRSFEFARVRFEAEVNALRATGSDVELLLPNEHSLDNFGIGLMDDLYRGESVRAGLQQGREEAERIGAFWG